MDSGVGKMRIYFWVKARARKANNTLQSAKAKVSFQIASLTMAKNTYIHYTL